MMLRERILAIHLLEKAEKQPELAKQIGIVANDEEMRKRREENVSTYIHNSPDFCIR